MSLVQTILAATELAIGGNAQYVWFPDPEDFTGDPGTTAANIGASVANSHTAYVIAKARNVDGRKSAFLTIDRALFSGSYNYVLVVNGTTYTTTGEASFGAAVQDLVDQINADTSDPLEDPLAAAIPSSTDQVLDTVHVWALDVGGVSGSATLAVNASTTHPTAGATKAYVDPETISVRVHLALPRDSALPIQVPWLAPANHDYGELPAAGLLERLAVAFADRLYVEVYDVTKFAGDGSGVTARPYIAIARAIQGS